MLALARLCEDFTMPRGDRQLEHVLRRIGFGASKAELARYAGRSVCDVIESLLNYEQFPDDVDAQHRQPRVRERDGARRLRAQHRGQRRTTTRAVSDGAQSAAAAGEDGALLAQPLRHGIQQDQRRGRRRARDQDDGGPPGRDFRQPARAVRAVSPEGDRKLRGPVV